MAQIPVKPSFSSPFEKSSRSPEDVQREIKETLQNHPIVLYMKGTPHQPQCGFSARVVDILQQTGTKFHSVNVLADHHIRNGIKEYGNWPTLPQLYVKGELIGGCDIVQELYEKGELEAILAQ